VIEDRSRTTLDQEVKALHDAGCATMLIVPDAASLSAFGPSLGDDSQRKKPEDAGIAQGRAESARIAKFWRIY